MFHVCTDRAALVVFCSALLSSTACMATYEQVRTTETTNQFDEQGNPISQTTTIGQSGGGRIEIDDRVIDVLPLFPRFRPVYVPTAPAATAGNPPDSGRAPQAFRTAARPDTVLDYFEINELTLQFMPGALTIDDGDWLDFEIAWNVEFRAAARDLITATFEHAAFPDARTLTYAGPAPAGIELAAVIGLRELTLPAEMGQITWLDPAFTPPSMAELFTLRIEPDADRVTINGLEVMPLGPDADILNP